MELQPKNFKLEPNTIWSFPDRGSWATHSGDYRGNWTPYVPRNLILRYTKERDWILDPFVGSGTTLVEAKLLGRNAIGVDVNSHALEVAENKLDFQCKVNSNIVLKKGDARNLDFIDDKSINLICMHPPYCNIIKYSDHIENDLSLMQYEEFLCAMNEVAREALRILKTDGICALMIGDMRQHGNIVPLGMQIMNLFLKNSFTLKEIIIKEQHNCKSTEYWLGKNRSFLLIAHEYIFVLKKS